MGKKDWRFGDIETERYKSFHFKSPISKEDMDIEKVLVSKKISSDEKNYEYFIGYLDND